MKSEEGWLKGGDFHRSYKDLIYKFGCLRFFAFRPSIFTFRIRKLIMKILVTGGAGYIGSHTVIELISAGHEPVIVDNFCNSDRSVLDGLREISGRDVLDHEGDCRDINFMRKVFETEGDIGGVIHFAALKAVGESVEKPDLYFKNNVGSLEILMQVMEEFKVSFLVFSSSACVYGDADVLPVTEETPLKKPESPYGETKQQCEELITQAVKDGRFFQAVSLRYFNPIGAHKSARIGELPIGVPNNLIPFVTQTAVGKISKLIIFGNDYGTPDGTAVRDYIHVIDVAKAHIKALEYLGTRSEEGKSKSESQNTVEQSPIAYRPFPFHEVFNLGTGKGNSVMEVIKTFEDVSGVTLNYEIGSRRKGDVETLYANCDKAERELGWKATLTLADALKDSWKWQVFLERR